MNRNTKIKILFLTLFLFTFLVVLFYNKLFGLAFNVTSSLTVIDEPKATIKWATPEGRVGAVETNDDTTFFLSVRNPITHSVLYNSDLYTTANDGTYLTPINFGPGVSSGISYDIGFKGKAHLTKILRNISLVSGTNNLNFTQADNSVTKGAIRLVAGDINGDGLTPATMGDDVVNSVDLSSILVNLDADDVTGNNIRANLNQDPVVNSVDLSLMLANLDKEGEK